MASFCHARSGPWLFGDGAGVEQAVKPMGPLHTRKAQACGARRGWLEADAVPPWRPKCRQNLGRHIDNVMTTFSGGITFRRSAWGGTGSIPGGRTALA